MQTLFSLLSIYIFIMLGFFAKHSFKDRLDEKTLVLISIYFLQPFLILWGFSSKSIDFEVIKAPLIFLFVVLVVFIFAYLFSKFFSNRQDRSIFIVTSIIGNTGNLGIPIGLMLFGKESVIYTTFINIINIFLVYIIGVFFYSLGNYSIKESIKNIFKLPAIWFVALALFLNLNHFEYPKEFELPLKMGAYATMVVQLFIFGMYLRGVELKKLDWKMFWAVDSFKFIFIPIVSILLLKLFELDRFVYNIILLELIVPIAVMNVNLASLYSCKPSKVAFLTFSTSVLFLGYLVGFVKFVF
jgi:predicted permease